MNGEQTGLPDHSARLLKAHEQATAEYRASHEMTTAHNLREDGLTLWFIGLAGGAIYVALEVVTAFSLPLRLGYFLIAVLPWGLSTVCGVLARIRHATAVLENDAVFLVRAQMLTGLPLEPKLSDAEMARQIVNVFEPSEKWPEAEHRKLGESAERVARSATRWALACRALLAIGIGWCPLLLWMHQRCS